MVSSKVLYGALAVASLYPQVSAWHNDKVVYDKYGHARMLKQRGPSCKPTNGEVGPTPQPGDGSDNLPSGSGPTQDLPSPPPVQGDGPTSTATATSMSSSSVGGSQASGPAGSSTASSASSVSSDSSSSSQGAPSSILSSSSANSPSASTTASSAAATTTSSAGCPPGSKFATFEDDFHTFDHSKWTYDLGNDEQVTFGPAGLTMTLKEGQDNIVFQSAKQWVAPVTMTARAQSASAGGIISSIIFKNADASDEIDLELIEGTWQVPLWQRGANSAQRLEFGRDVVGTLASTAHNLTSWVYDDTNIVPFQKLHDWEVMWDADVLTWSADGKQLLDLEKLPTGTLWPSEPLHVRFGPWASAGGWAGKLDWAKNSAPKMIIEKIKVEGCQLE